VTASLWDNGRLGISHHTGSKNKSVSEYGEKSPDPNTMLHKEGISDKPNELECIASGFTGKSTHAAAGHNG